MMRRIKEFFMLIFLMTILSVFSVLVWFTSWFKVFAPFGIVNPNHYSERR